MLSGPDLLHHQDDHDKCEYLVGTHWIKKLDQKDARFKKKAGLFARQPIVASLSSQLKTLHYLENEFGVSFEKLLTES